MRPPRSILSPAPFLEEPLWRVVVWVIEMEVTGLTNHYRFGKGVEQEAQISGMGILFVGRKHVGEIRTDRGLDVCCDLAEILDVPSVDQCASPIPANEESGKMGVKLISPDAGLKAARHDVNAGRQLALPEAHILHAVLH